MLRRNALRTRLWAANDINPAHHSRVLVTQNVAMHHQTTSKVAGPKSHNARLIVQVFWLRDGVIPFALFKHVTTPSRTNYLHLIAEDNEGRGHFGGEKKTMSNGSLLFTPSPNSLTCEGERDASYCCIYSTRVQPRTRTGLMAFQRQTPPHSDRLLSL